jgi:hypothetical protein
MRKIKSYVSFWSTRVHKSPSWVARSNEILGWEGVGNRQLL